MVARDNSPFSNVLIFTRVPPLVGGDRRAPLNGQLRYDEFRKLVNFHRASARVAKLFSKFNRIL